MIVFGLNGSDSIQTPGYRSAEIRCGTGNCHVTGSYANDVLVGGGGSNQFVGNGGNDVIVTGLGRNTVQATGAGNSLLVAGQVTGVQQTYDNLRANGDAWAASPLTANLSLLVAAVNKPNTTANQDILTGGSGADAYIVRLPTDLVTNYSPAKMDKEFFITMP